MITYDGENEEIKYIVNQLKIAIVEEDELSKQILLTRLKLKGFNIVPEEKQ
jgi:hypothetical protein